jgi:hypothetical protein
LPLRLFESLISRKLAGSNRSLASSSQKDGSRSPVRWTEPRRFVMVFKLQRCWKGLRRLCAFFLLLLAVAPCLLTFAASSAAEASLPTCCRAHGRHKCFLRMTRTEYPASNLSQPGIPQASERCAYSPTFPLSPHTSSLGQPAGFSAAARLNIAATTEMAATERRTPFILQANRKRGPPSSVLASRIH